MSRVGFSIGKGIIDEDSGELVEGAFLKKIDLVSYLRVYHNSGFKFVDGWYLRTSYEFPSMN